jgi:hypothetical protein
MWPEPCRRPFGPPGFAHSLACVAAEVSAASAAALLNGATGTAMGSISPSAKNLFATRTAGCSGEMEARSAGVPVEMFRGAGACVGVDLRVAPWSPACVCWCAACPRADRGVREAVPRRKAVDRNFAIDSRHGDRRFTATTRLEKPACGASRDSALRLRQGDDLKVLRAFERTPAWQAEGPKFRRGVGDHRRVISR